MKTFITLILLLPLFAFAAEHGGEAAKSKEHAGEAAEHASDPMSLKD